MCSVCNVRLGLFAIDFKGRERERKPDNSVCLLEEFVDFACWLFFSRLGKSLSQGGPCWELNGVFLL